MKIIKQRLRCFLLVIVSLVDTYEKSVEPFCCSHHDVKALALPDKSETNNADTTPIQRQISCNIQNDKKLCVNANIYSI